MSDPQRTVFIVDDDASFRRGIERLLRSAGYVTECFSSARDFLASHPPGAMGCLLADLQMPETDGLEMQAAVARFADPLPIVFLSGQADVPSSVAAMRMGAVDFLLKTAPKEAVLAAIEQALERDVREREARARRRDVHSRFAKLTPRERDVLCGVAQGQRNKQIAADLGIDERSVKRHRTNLMRKLGFGSVAELVQVAVEAGVIIR